MTMHPRASSSSGVSRIDFFRESRSARVHRLGFAGSPAICPVLVSISDIAILSYPVDILYHLFLTKLIKSK
nr:MAG TPA: hypothetical protein [Caudoviricetes sp.]